MSGSTTYESPSVFNGLKDTAHDRAVHPVDPRSGRIRAAASPLAAAARSIPHPAAPPPVPGSSLADIP